MLQVLQARPDYLQRVALWREMLRLIDLNTIEGWGFVGFWRRDAYPYTALDLVSRGAQETGRNAYLDLYLQAGLVGLALFAAFCALALGRSWVLATTKRGVGYVWTALVLVVLVVASLAERHDRGVGLGPARDLRRQGRAGPQLAARAPGAAPTRLRPGPRPGVGISAPPRRAAGGTRRTCGRCSSPR